MRHQVPIVYLNRRGGLSGLGQPSAFTEEALAQKLSELASVRAEVASLEAQIQSVKTGVPAGAPDQQSGGGLPGGSVDLPVVGRVPVLAVVGAGVAALMFMRRR